MKYIVGLGEVLFDCLQTGETLGGAPANFAYHASQFGFPAAVISAVGSDKRGNSAVDQLSVKQMTLCIPKVEKPTGIAIAHVDEEGVPHWEIVENVAWDHIPFTYEMEELAANTRAVCFGSLAQRSEVSRETINRFLDAVPADAMRIFDINIRQHYYTREVIEQSLRKANVFKLNDDELLILRPMLGTEDQTDEQFCKMLLDKYHLDYVILTCGTDGSYAFSATEQSFMPTPEVKVADTVGAGDSFTATFVAQILLGKSMREAHEKAVTVSAFVCTQNGAMPVLPEELKK